MELTSSSSAKQGVIAQNTFINLTGKVIPLLFAVITIPFIIKGLGTARFGVLALIWSIIGYFGMFDMGLGRATAKFAADQEADGKSLLPIIFTSMVLLIGIGLIAGLIIFLVTPWLVNDILNIPQPLVDEIRHSFYILSASIPIILGTVGLRGLLQAEQRFALINIVKIPASIINYISPLIILIFTKNLQYIVAFLAIERALTFIIYSFYCLKKQPVALPSDYSFSKWSKKMLGYGAWLTVSGVINSFMIYLDRFIIGAVLTISAMAYYITPFEVVNRISVVSVSFMEVLFPAFSVYFLYNLKKFNRIYQESFRYTLFVISPIVTVFLLGAQPLLTFWLGREFAQHSAVILQILAIAIFINSIASVSGTLLKAAGKPDLIAKLHLAELPIYLVLLWYFTHWFGIKGVALVWLIRVFLDCIGLFYYGNRLTSFSISWKELFVKLGMIVFAVFIGLIIMLQWLNNPIVTFFYALFWGLLIFYIAWRYVLQIPQRNKIKNLLQDVRLRVLKTLSNHFQKAE